MKNISTVTRDLDVTRKIDLDNLSSTITTKLAGKLTVYPISGYNVDTCYDAGIYLVAGSNCPSGSQYGSLLVMPFRKATGNTTTDFCTQIFIPNGDDSSKPNSMFYRTSLRSGWNSWQEVAKSSDLSNKLTTSNIIAGSNITLTTSGNNVTINATTGSGGTNVYVNSVKQDTVNFDSDPQTQITSLSTQIADLQTQINNMLNGTTTFTKVTAKIVDLVD